MIDDKYILDQINDFKIIESDMTIEEKKDFLKKLTLIIKEAREELEELNNCK